MQIDTEKKPENLEKQVYLVSVPNDEENDVICEKVAQDAKLNRVEKQALKLAVIHQRNVKNPEDIKFVVGVWSDPDKKNQKFIAGIYDVSGNKDFDEDFTWKNGIKVKSLKTDSYIYQNCSDGDLVFGLPDDFENQRLYIKKTFNWDKEEVLEVARKYNQAYENGGNDLDVSWITKEDQNKFIIDDHNRSLPFGVPNQVIGNPESSNFYLCLFNPRIRAAKNDDQIKTIKEYVDSENDPKGSEYHEDLEDYYRQITYDPTQSNNNRNILAQELRALLSDDDWENNMNKEYYLLRYYSPLFASKEIKDSDKKAMKVFKKLREINDPKFFDDLAICNLELLPYRSVDSGKDLVHLKDGYQLKDLATSMFVAKLIVDRINNKNLPRPFFVFRKNSKWMSVIKEYLRINQLENTRFEDLEKYFYKFPNASAALTEGYISEETARTVDSDKGPKNLGVSDDVYLEMRKAVGITKEMGKKLGFDEALIQKLN